MLHWPQYCSHHSGQTRLVLQSSGTLENRKFSSLARFFLWFRSIRSTGWFQRDRASKTTRVSIYSWNIYLLLFVYPSMCLFISLGPSKYPQQYGYSTILPYNLRTFTIFYCLLGGCSMISLKSRWQIRACSSGAIKPSQTYPSNMIQRGRVSK